MWHTITHIFRKYIKYFLSVCLYYCVQVRLSIGLFGLGTFHFPYRSFVLNADGFLVPKQSQNNMPSILKKNTTTHTQLYRMFINTDDYKSGL